MMSDSHQGTGKSSGFRTVAMVGLALAYVAVVLVMVQLLSPVLGGTDLSTAAATLVVGGLLFPLWRRLTAPINRPRRSSRREERTQMTSKGISRRVVAGLLALAAWAMFILVFVGLLAPFTSESDIVIPLVTLTAAAGFVIAHQRLPR
jgi:hypothetical protein